uniref:Major facilitator superfamily (MFS) profile domain-containing protein n=1 Tax=Globisporangium ultimum (strain ATCC 200006 / CBS 805.95 / DAOM BR144) TaxID=431595 RepID=K3XBY0_GLOUD
MVQATESQFKQDPYAEIKSPTVDNSGLLGQYENGALRAARGSVSVFSWQNLGMAVHMAGVGVVYSTISGVIYSVLNNYLHMSATLVATATALVQFPRSLRLFTGMLTDTVPIFGYRRRPYMVLGWGLSFVSCLLMAILPLGDPYYGDKALASLDPSQLTHEQLEMIDTDAPQRGVKLIILMMIANFGTVVAYSGFNGVLIDVSQREPANIRGTAMGDGMVVFYVFSVFSSFFTGLGLNSADYGGTFSWSIGFNAIMGICAGMSLITLPFSWFCIQEDKVESGPSKSVFVFLYELLQVRIIYRYVAFRFFYNVLALFSVTASSAIQSQWAKVEPVNNGIATMLAAFVTMIGTYVVKKYGLAWNWRYIIISAQIAVVCVDVFPTMFTIWNVFRSQWFWLGVPLLEKLPYAATDYVGALFMLEVESEGFEASLFGLAVTSQRVGTPFATVLTKSVDGYLDIERNYIQKDDHHVRSQVTIAYVIAYAVNLLAIVFVVLLPRQKDELHKMQQEGAKNKVKGTATICVLIFALAWSLMTNILSLFDSTKCLRIAGGSGC